MQRCSSVLLPIGLMATALPATAQIGGGGPSTTSRPPVTVAPSPPAVDDAAELRRMLAAERRELERQQRSLDEQRARIDRLAARLSGTPAVADLGTALSPGGVPLPASPPPAPPVTIADAAPPSRTTDRVQTVGEAPSDQRQVQVAVLSEQGGIITKAGRATIELNL